MIKLSNRMTARQIISLLPFVFTGGMEHDRLACTGDVEERKSKPRKITTHTVSVR